MKRELGLTASILNGTNKIVSSSEANWEALRQGSFIKFNGDTTFYTIGSKQDTLYIKDFEVVNPKQIRCFDTDINVLHGDTLQISFKKFQCVSVLNILNPGIGYKVGDKISLRDGRLIKNNNDNSVSKTVLLVNSVGAAGNILTVSIFSAGQYFSPPSVFSFYGGNGSQAVIELQFEIADERGFFEREVDSLSHDAESTYINLNFQLPDGLIFGKFSIEKWYAFLDSIYTGESKVNSAFEVVRDFTPNLHLPLIVKNSTNPELVFNEALVRIDAEIAALKELLSRK